MVILNTGPATRSRGCKWPRGAFAGSRRGRCRRGCGSLARFRFEGDVRRSADSRRGALRVHVRRRLCVPGRACLSPSCRGARGRRFPRGARRWRRVGTPMQHPPICSGVSISPRSCGASNAALKRSIGKGRTAIPTPTGRGFVPCVPALPTFWRGGFMRRRRRELWFDRRDGGRRVRAWNWFSPSHLAPRRAGSWPGGTIRRAVGFARRATHSPSCKPW